MSQYVWCKKEEARLPIYRCFFCGKTCYPDKEISAEKDRVITDLLESGRFKECYVMKRKSTKKEAISVLDFGTQERERKKEKGKESQSEEGRIFLLENGDLKPFSPDDFTTSTLYHEEESYSIERKLVRPGASKNVVFSGKRPSKSTTPIIVTRDGRYILVESWQELDANPQHLLDAREVIGASAVKQVFVLTRK